MAFLSSIPLPAPPRARQTVHSHHQITAKAKKPTRAKPANPSSSTPKSSKPSQKQPSPPSADSLKTSLLKSLSGLNRGLSIDADAEILTPEEAIVEDTISELELLSTTTEPTSSPYLGGTWVLLYTSSSITRFFGGITGFQRLLPGGEIGEIRQVIDTEDGTSKYIENIKFELPVAGNIEWVATAEGSLRKTSDARMLWEPERVKIGWFSWFADSWKTLRAFQISDITYIDDTIRITRGTTDSVHVYQKV